MNDSYVFRIRFRKEGGFDGSRERWEPFNCETDARALDEAKAIQRRSGPEAVVLVYAYKDRKLLGAVQTSED